MRVLARRTFSNRVRVPARGGSPALVALGAASGLVAAAVTHPLLDLVGRNAEFFLARASPASDIVALGLVVGLAVPLAMGVLVAMAVRLHSPVGRGLLGLLVTFCAALLVIQVARAADMPQSPVWAVLTLAVSAGILLALVVDRSQSLRGVLRYGMAVPVVSTALFLSASPASALVAGAGAINEPAGIWVDRPAPIVFVVFDEFPLASVINERGELEEGVYPNFGRLADDAIWFRNAVTTQQQSAESVPAILTGNNPPDDLIPVARDHPANLFTLLSEDYRIAATEEVTALCPDYACGNRTRPRLPTSQRWASLASDLAVVSGHLLLPVELTERLPSIDQAWAFFGPDQVDRSDFDIIDLFLDAVDRDRRKPVLSFIEGLGDDPGEPTLDFIHVMLPHIPWEYAETGQSYEAPSPAPGSARTGWGDDDWLVNQSYQRHLMQVQYTDALLGQLLDRLQQEGIYDQTLIVVLADHGVTIRPGIDHRRVAREDTVGEIAAIPLFIKLPGQEEGYVDDYRAETTDVLPTIADVLGIRLPWPTDGVSLLDEDRPERTSSRIAGHEGVVTFPAAGEEKLAVAERKIEAFGRDGPYGLAPQGYDWLLGASTDSLASAVADGLEVALDHPERYESVDPDAPVLPLYLSGRLVGAGTSQDEAVVAIGLNGRIVAVTRTYSDEGEPGAFYAMVPPKALVPGNNLVQAYLLDSPNAGDGILELSVSSRS